MAWVSSLLLLSGLVCFLAHWMQEVVYVFFVRVCMTCTQVAGAVCGAHVIIVYRDTFCLFFLFCTSRRSLLKHDFQKLAFRIDKTLLYGTAPDPPDPANPGDPDKMT